MWKTFFPEIDKETYQRILNIISKRQNKIGLFLFSIFFLIFLYMWIFALDPFNSFDHNLALAGYQEPDAGVDNMPAPLTTGVKETSADISPAKTTPSQTTTATTAKPIITPITITSSSTSSIPQCNDPSCAAAGAPRD